MDSIVIVLVLLAMISVLVVAHEWGHFIVARIFKIRVDDFSIGFGPRILRIGKLGDTEYNIRAFPLGGFVKIAGMDPDEEPLIKARDAITGSKGSTDVEAAKEASDVYNGELAANTKDLFYSKPIWQRSLVILAGPGMSFIFGVIVLCLAGFTIGVPGDTPTAKIAEVMPGGQAYKIGLRSGDVIKQIDNQPIVNGGEMINIVHMSYGRALRLVVDRDGKTMTFTGTPQQMTDPQTDLPVYAYKVVQPNSFAAAGVMPGDIIFDTGDPDTSSNPTFVDQLKTLAGQKTTIGIWRDNHNVTAPITLTPAVMGNLPSVSNYQLGMLKFQPAFAIERTSFAVSVSEGWHATGRMFGALGSMFKHRQIRQLKDSTGGIVMMYSVTGLAVKNGLSTVVIITAQLSFSLAIFNLLPIPVLDGGHLLTFFIEWVRRGKRFTDQQQQVFLITGVLVIGTLFALIFTNDIHRLISHQVPQ